VEKIKELKQKGIFINGRDKEQSDLDISKMRFFQEILV
jgi:hypothetical protein